MTVTMRYALKIAYDGTKFSGSQRQPNVRTVDGECIFVLKKIKAIVDTRKARFQSASRTDTGVGAVGNVIAFDTLTRKDAIVGAFNSAARNVWAWAVANVPDDFRARNAVQRWYRYFMRGDFDIETVRVATRLFVGEHDFKRFTQDKNNTTRKVNSIEVLKGGDFIVLDFKAQSYLRSMIRRIVAAIEKYCMGEIKLNQIERALKGDKFDFGLASAEPLVLVDVEYDFDFQVVPSRKINKEINELLEDYRLGNERLTLMALKLGVR